MAEKKQDLRIQKTQRALAMAMLTLLEKQSFGKITVNDLCAEAMVSRSAFYTHFEDKYALLSFCMDVLKQRMFEESEGQDLRARIRSVLEKAQENVKIFRNLLMSELDMELIEMLRRAFQEDFEKLLDARKVEGQALPGPLEVISVYYASGISTAIMYWLGRNMPYPIDEMTDCLVALLPAIE
ncbi:TetR/AcrR family transcriptional regulator [Clostridia bacterium OttesenSCG-928-O13]|nr:TetR/AcrR family transcriptional regulator [Clostridia bacterium OttesenSCG-928-O13]